MGRPPPGGPPAFRFLPNEVAVMEKLLEQSKGSPSIKAARELVEKFSKDPERDGKISVHYKQVLHWFRNRRYAVKKKAEKQIERPLCDGPNKGEIVSTTALSEEVQLRNMEFEAKSSMDGAWYDVHSFLAHRMLDSGDPEVRVRFVGFGPDDDEWVNVRNCVRERSLPCEASECVSILPGDLVLCFQEGHEQALYYDAYVLEIKRRRHDIRGCRCRFFVQYEQDGSTDVVPLRKMCRRPEAKYRAQHAQAVGPSPVTMKLTVHNNTNAMQ